ncbi:MAG: YbaB/EbfC family nucleoid-associated protein [Dehalococcoidales bacterium]|nr:YbaB/EbfC family nucleoid-associated protein [Dehalococcoidales bacterium]
MNNKFMMQQAQKLQSQLAKAQEDLANITVEASAGGGAVNVTANGQQKIISVSIAKEAVDPQDVTMLQDLILTAVNEALTKSQAAANQQLSQLTAGFKIPGLM